LDLFLFLASSHGVSEICDRERRCVPASLLLPYPLFTTLVSKSSKEESLDSNCFSSLKYEICLTVSLGSNGSRSLSGLPEELSHRISSTILLPPRVLMKTSPSIICILFREAMLFWSSCSSSVPVKILPASNLNLILPMVSFHGLDLQFCWQSFGPYCISSRPIYVDFGPISFSTWPRSVPFNLYYNPLIMPPSCIISSNVLSLMTTTMTTLLVCYCSQRLSFPLKKSSRIILEERIVKKILMLCDPVWLRQWHVRVSLFALSGLYLPVFIFITHRLKHHKIDFNQHPQSSSVHILNWFQISKKVSAIVRKAFDLRFRALNLPLSDLKGPFYPNSSTKERHLVLNSSFMERSLFSPSSFMERTVSSNDHLRFLVLKLRNRLRILTVLLSFVVEDVSCFAPAKLKVMGSFSTSQWQCLVTNPLLDLFVDVSSTLQCLVCFKMLFSSCLLALLDLRSYYRIYLCFAFLNALSFDVLNSEFFELLWISVIFLFV